MTWARRTAPPSMLVAARRRADAVLARDRRAERRQPASMASLAMRFVPAGVALTLDADGSRIVEATDGGVRLDRAGAARNWTLEYLARKACYV